MKNLRRKRISKGWTLEYVASKTGVSKQTVYDWEQGRRYPSYQALCRLEDLFQMSHRELLSIDNSHCTA